MRHKVIPRLYLVLGIVVVNRLTGSAKPILNKRSIYYIALASAKSNHNGDHTIETKH